MGKIQNEAEEHLAQLAFTNLFLFILEELLYKFYIILYKNEKALPGLTKCNNKKNGYKAFK